MPPSPTNPLSGRWGAVAIGSTATPAGTVRNWMVNSLQTPKTFVASNTKIGTGRRTGLFDWNGNFGSYSPFPVAMPGQEFGFIGYVGPDDGITPHGIGTTADGPAILESITINWDWMTNEIISMVYNFQGNGELVITTSALADTRPIFAEPSSIAHPTLEIYTGETPVEWTPCVQSCSLTISASLLPYSNSCVSPFLLRRAGIIDWTLAMVLQESDIQNATNTVPIEEGMYAMVTLPVSPSQFYRLRFGKVRDFTNYVVDIETGKLVNYTINFDMSIDDENENDGFGSIYVPDPAGTALIWWPFAGS